SVSEAGAVEALNVLTSTERVCAAGRTRVARRLERSKAWQGQGHRSAAHWLASQTGVSVGQAVGVLETGRSLEHLGATADAFACGELSETKVREVAAAAAACPASDTELLGRARTAP